MPVSISLRHTDAISKCPAVRNRCRNWTEKLQFPESILCLFTNANLEIKINDSLKSELFLKILNQCWLAGISLFWDPTRVFNHRCRNHALLWKILRKKIQTRTKQNIINKTKQNKTTRIAIGNKFYILNKYGKLPKDLKESSKFCNNFWFPGIYCPFEIVPSSLIWPINGETIFQYN